MIFFYGLLKMNMLTALSRPQYITHDEERLSSFGRVARLVKRTCLTNVSITLIKRQHFAFAHSRAGQPQIHTVVVTVASD